ncbi:hypothetical protein PH7735_02940 [Shimia thalassica]|uniref:Uncharacterized protein n=1 Tax=Shimia thalassica TaxID=1715693 RepID=A0A0P1ICW3_9RHOB|nr:hypothetical protein PH7735_02940 [Shimia thalassica]
MGSLCAALFHGLNAQERHMNHEAACLSECFGDTKKDG